MERTKEIAMIAGVFTILGAIINPFISIIYSISSTPNEADWIEKGNDFSSVYQYKSY